MWIFNVELGFEIKDKGNRMVQGWETKVSFKWVFENI